MLIDAADDDPVRVWTYVATAVDRIRPGLGRRGALARLRVAGASATSAVDELVNGITTYGQPLALVLDEFTLQSDAGLHSFEHAVECLPAHARIVATKGMRLECAQGRTAIVGTLTDQAHTCKDYCNESRGSG